MRMQGAVAVMHAAGVVHADLKPENVLLRAPVATAAAAQDDMAPDQAPEIAVCDFGSAFSERETDTAKLACEMQTLPYRAPEARLFWLYPTASPWP
jgi:homeodomain interacting protein kinase